MANIIATFSCDTSAALSVVDAFAALPPDHPLLTELEAAFDGGEVFILSDCLPDDDGAMCVAVRPSEALKELAERAKRADL